MRREGYHLVKKLSWRCPNKFLHQSHYWPNRAKQLSVTAHKKIQIVKKISHLTQAWYELIAIVGVAIIFLLPLKL